MKKHVGTVLSLSRKVRRLFWLVVWAVTHQYVKAMHFLARYSLFLRGFIRRYLAKPIQKISSHALAQSRNLPAPDRHSITLVEVTTETEDGIILNGTLYLPVEPDHDSHDHGIELQEEHKFPTIIARTPYGRYNIGPIWAQVFAERGYACLIQDTRGRFGSGGDFFPVKNEKVDGGATIEWVRKQPWSNGKVALFGVSYLGLTTYAAAGSDAGRHVDAIVPVMTSAQTYGILYHGEGGPLAMDLVLRWLWLAVKLLNTVNVYKFWIPLFQGELNQVFGQAPLRDQDEKLIGKKLDFLQEAIRATSLQDEFWVDKNLLCDLAADERPPAHIVGGWYDFFIKGTFQDFEDALKAKQKPCKLTVGKWKHWDFTQYGAPSLKLALEFFDKYLKTSQELEDEGIVLEDDGCAVHVAFLGTSPTRWVGFKEWPPRTSNLCKYPLENTKKGKIPLSAALSGYRYDPRDPTPYLGGPSFDPFNSGCVEQSSLEERADVLTFTSEPVQSSLYICGDVFVELHAKSSNPFTDFYFKLCDVTMSGTKSFNLVEGIIRYSENDWESRVMEDDGQVWYHTRRTVKVGPIAQCFRTGHSWRLQISGGAHPLYMRNFGTGEDIADAVTLRHADHRIFHDTKVVLPVIDKVDVDQATMAHPAYPDHQLTHDHP